jgi:N-acetylglutamate synthase-like GNAT family acetyltransferase
MDTPVGKDRALPDGISIRHEPEPGDIGYLVYLHGHLYAQEFGWDATFEAGMAGPLATFATSLAERDRLWLVEDRGHLAGSNAVEEKSETEAELRWLLLHPDLRGEGIGRLLVEESVAFCRYKEYQTVYLWTVKVLEAATQLYKSVGFDLTDERQEERWGESVTMQRYELQLE